MALSRHDWMLAWVNLIHAGSFLGAGLDAHFREKLGISLPEQDLLNVLEKVGGEIGLSELARRVFFSKSGMTKMVDRLEAAGMVARQPSSVDRRVISARLTAKGRKVLQRSRRQLEAWVEENFRAHLSDTQIVELREALRALLESHQRYQGQMAHLRGESHD